MDKWNSKGANVKTDAAADTKAIIDDFSACFLIYLDAISRTCLGTRRFFTLLTGVRQKSTDFLKPERLNPGKCEIEFIVMLKGTCQRTCPATNALVRIH